MNEQFFFNSLFCDKIVFNYYFDRTEQYSLVTQYLLYHLMVKLLYCINKTSVIISANFVFSAFVFCSTFLKLFGINFKFLNYILINQSV